MNYQKIYENIITRGRARATSRKEANEILGGYCEQHHIVPKCMGGTDDLENLVYLSAREHFVVHLLLVKIYSRYKGLLFAARLLSKNSKTSKEYEWVKKQLNEYQRTQTSENNEGIARGAEKKRGRTKENHPGVAAISNALTGRNAQNDKSVAAGVEKRRGRTKETHQSVANSANSKRGRTKETHNYLLNQSERQKGQTKETCESIARQAEALTGRTKETHSYLIEQGKKVSEALTGRTKETHPGLLITSQKLTKFPIEIKYQIYEKRYAGIPGKEVYKWLTEDLGYEIGYSSISAIYNDIKKNKSKWV